jgi:hypothetical protein
MQYRNHLFQVSAIVILALLITSSLAGAQPGDTPPEGNVDARFHTVRITGTAPAYTFIEGLKVTGQEYQAGEGMGSFTIMNDGEFTVNVPSTSMVSRLIGTFTGKDGGGGLQIFNDGHLSHSTGPVEVRDSMEIGDKYNALAIDNNGHLSDGNGSVYIDDDFESSGWGWVHDDFGVDGGTYLYGDAFIDKSQAQINFGYDVNGSGTNTGPHGLVFTDDNGHGLQLFFRTGDNQVTIEDANDNDEIFFVDADNDEAYFKGKVGIATTEPTGALHIYPDTDADLSNSNASLVIGNPSGEHLEMDRNEIMAKSNASTASTLFLQHQGGDLKVDNGTLYVDAADNSVGIGTTTPSAPLEVSGRVSQIDLGNSNFFGYDAGLNDDGSSNANIGFGYQALKNNTSGYQNIAVGYQSLLSNTGGYRNTAVGYQALDANTTADYNTAIGQSSLTDATTGGYNTATGGLSLADNTTGTYNSAFGYEALRLNTTGGTNSSFGGLSLSDNTTGSHNSALGYKALESNKTASYNTAIGHYALNSSTSSNNTAVGGYALSNITSGSPNTALGYGAGRYISGGATANTTTGSSTYIGYNTKANANGVTNENVFGYDATGAGSNSVVLGNDDITRTLLKGDVEIGNITLSPTSGNTGFMGSAIGEGLDIISGTGTDDILSIIGNYIKNALGDNVWILDSLITSGNITSYGSYITVAMASGPGKLTLTRNSEIIAHDNIFWDPISESEPLALRADGGVLVTNHDNTQDLFKVDWDGDIIANDNEIEEGTLNYTLTIDATDEYRKCKDGQIMTGLQKIKSTGTIMPLCSEL